MNLIENYFKLKNEEQNFFFKSALIGAGLLYSPQENTRYNQKHIIECLFYSFIMHTASIEIYAPQLKSVYTKLEIKDYLKNLIFESDPIDRFNEKTFLILFVGRVDVIMSEMQRLAILDQSQLKVYF